MHVLIYKDNDNNNIFPVNRTYVADIRTEPMDSDYDHDPENFPHTYSPPFNPYRESKEENSHARTVVQKLTRLPWERHELFWKLYDS